MQNPTQNLTPSIFVARSIARSRRRAAPRNGGFTLLELVLALGLGLLVVAGIVNLFVGNSQTYSVLTGQSRLQENARFAFDFISRSARSAGYFGCGPDPENIVRGLRGGWANIPEFNITRRVEGHDGGSGGSFSPALTSLPGGTGSNAFVAANGIDTSRIVDGTDVLVLRTLGNPTRLAAVLQPNGAPVVDAPGGVAPVSVDDVVMVADCEQAALFRITGLTLGATSASLAAATTTSGSLFENRDQVESATGTLVPFTLSELSRAYGREAVLGRVETDIFFIAPSAATNNVGNTPLALWQKRGSAPPLELVSGVDDMEVLYGVDTTNTDGMANANQYLDFNNVADPDQIVSLRITLAVNSVDTVSDTGTPLSRTYTKTLLLRNADGGV